MNALITLRCLSLLLLAITMTSAHPIRPAHPADPLDRFTSSKTLGCTVRNGTTTFRVFAPRATGVMLVLFDRAGDEAGKEYRMTHDPADGVWELKMDSVLYGLYYGYKIAGPSGPGELFDSSIVVGDPYAKAVCTKNNYHLPAKTLIFDDSYDWGDDHFVVPANHNRLVIYEAHLRDLTADPSSGIKQKGTYAGLTETGHTGGLSYLKKLGVNAIEFLPLQKFGTIELPYRDSTHRSDLGEVNTWNPYERNHWGYMTSFFFAPETYYASDGTMERERYNGTDARAVKEMKDMIRTLHREGFAVIMDVVYNHVSQYDYNSFKFIDRKYYFRADSNGTFLHTSGCGNDFYTERPMARRLIVESVKFWMKEYHIDGFRFDLGALIDPTTRKEIGRAARAINPNVLLVAEAWGGGKYELDAFSDIGWASWNDQIRNGVKGQNPYNGLGFIFGKFQGSNTKKSVESFVTGTLRKDGGPFLRKEHSISYLESHDDNTLGDFIRFGTGTVKAEDRITDRKANATLTPRELALNKLAALFLMATQGPVMMHEGQEYARSKVIAPTSSPDTNVGRIDHNSYEKDNETNWLNYDEQKLSTDLTEYYSGLISLRNRYPLLSDAPEGGVTFLPTADDFLIAYTIRSSRRSDRPLCVILNGNPSDTAHVKLPRGQWAVLADAKAVSPTGGRRVTAASVAVPPTSGMILVRR